ncbi:MAG: Fpg/Nei family DNA glycosylase [Caulobacteraceae bacterium]|nr:Fpg/Nei family DNA glycosylase [Caulobacter sp.]
MPEGHALHRAARDQRPCLAGQALGVSSPQGRFALGAERLDGRRCEDVQAYGKHLLYAFEGELALHLHLGLYGRFRTYADAAPEPRGQVRVRLQAPGCTVDCSGPAACEVLEPAECARLLARIGPDVLRTDADPELAWARIGRSRTGIGALLMDQSVMSGIGNIYRTELLWRARIHPLTPGRALTRAQFEALWADAVHLLRLGVETGAIVTREGAGPSRRRYRERVNIMAKETCPRCDGPIERLTIAGRRAFACPHCQPPPPAA